MKKQRNLLIVVSILLLCVIQNVSATTYITNERESVKIEASTSNLAVNYSGITPATGTLFVNATYFEFKTNQTDDEFCKLDSVELFWEHNALDLSVRYFSIFKLNEDGSCSGYANVLGNTDTLADTIDKMIYEKLDFDVTLYNNQTTNSTWFFKKTLHVDDNVTFGMTENNDYVDRVKYCNNTDTYNAMEWIGRPYYEVDADNRTLMGFFFDNEYVYSTANVTSNLEISELFDFTSFSLITYWFNHDVEITSVVDTTLATTHQYRPYAINLTTNLEDIENDYTLATIGSEETMIITSQNKTGRCVSVNATIVLMICVVDEEEFAGLDTSIENQMVVTQRFTEYYEVSYDLDQYIYIIDFFNFGVVILLTIGLGKRLELSGREYITLFVMDFMMLASAFSSELFYVSLVIGIVFTIIKMRELKSET